MSTELTTQTVGNPPEHKMLVALAPQDVPAAQQELTDWCLRQIRALGAASRELHQSIEIAERNRWRRSTLQKHLGKTKAEIGYYRKIVAAVEAGYLIVPNFDLTVMALRVTSDQCPVDDFDTNKRLLLETNAQHVSLVPLGEGEYVSPKAKACASSRPAPTDKDPHARQAGWVNADYFQAVSFPVRAVKPIIMDATSLAMSKRIFDRIGVVTGRKQDPVVVGEIFHPADRWRQRRVSFFIAWWFDTRSL